MIQDKFRMSAGSDESSKTSVTAKDNHIYCYCAIDENNMLELIKSFRTMQNEILYNSIVTNSAPVTIYIHINSYGGFVLDGLNAADEIINAKVPVVTSVEGAAMSAATLLSIVGTRRTIKRHSVMLVHQLSGGSWGTYKEQVDAHQNATLMMEMIKSLLQSYTKLTPSMLDDLLEHDLYLSAEKCLEYGMVDEIIGDRDEQ